MTDTHRPADDPERHLPPHHSPLPSMEGAPATTMSVDDFHRVQNSDDFRQLRSTFRNFAFPMTAAFLIWYFGYVLLSTYAPSLMTMRVVGHVNLGLLLGLLQFVTTFLITYLYIRHANANLDPIATKLREELEGKAL